MKRGKIISNFTDFGNREWRDKLIGGKADKKTPEDFDSIDLEIGSSVQREHTNDPDLALTIAMDHISEDPEYYDKLISSGIADEPKSRELFDELKGKNARNKAKQDIMDYMDSQDIKYEEEEEEEDDNLDDDTNIDDMDDDYLSNDEEYGEDEYDEDEFDDDDEYDNLGTDKKDVDDEDLIIDNKLKNNNKTMENFGLKNFENFLRLKESQEQVNDIPTPVEGTPPERALSKEQKYKYQIEFDESIVQDLKDRFFKPTSDKKTGKYITLNNLDLSYTITDERDNKIRPINRDILRSIFDNL